MNGDSSGPKPAPASARDGPAEPGPAPPRPEPYFPVVGSVACACHRYHGDRPTPSPIGGAAVTSPFRSLQGVRVRVKTSSEPAEREARGVCVTELGPWCGPPAAEEPSDPQ